MYIEQEIKRKLPREVKVRELHLAHKTRLIYPMRRALSRAFLELVKQVPEGG